MEDTLGTMSNGSTVLRRSQMPKIGGSVAGFVALIVVLCLVIIISLTAIILLLRGERDTDPELQKNQRPNSATYVTPFDDESRSPPSAWLRRTYQRLPFIRTGSTDRIPSIKVPQLPSSNGSLARSAEELRNDFKDDNGLKPPQYHYNRNPYISKLGVRTSVSMSNSIRRLSTPTPTSSLRFEMGGVRDIPPYERRFAPSPTNTLPTIYTQMSSGASTPASIPSSPRPSRTMSHEIPSFITPASPRHEQDITRYSVLSSSTTPPTFEGGSKFLEAL